VTAAVLRRAALVLAVAALGLAGCGGDDDGDGGASGFVELDGTPRRADDAGVLTEVAEDFSSLTLDGDRRFDIHEELTSFAAADGSIQPVGRYVGNYVQVGLDDDGDTVQWLGSIASIVDTADQPPVAYFTGVLVDVDDGRLVFRSGTVLEAANSVETPDVPASVVATIDVESGTVTAIERG
jgi:hypothetical protein